MNKNTSRITKEYADAIASSARSGFLHHQALSNELAGNFFVAKDPIYAASYFQNARNLYWEYGAHAKVKHIEELCSTTYRLDLDVVGTSAAVQSSRGSAYFARERVPQRVSLLAKEMAHLEQSFSTQEMTCNNST